MTELVDDVDGQEDGERGGDAFGDEGCGVGDGDVAKVVGHVFWCAYLAL